MDDKLSKHSMNIGSSFATSSNLSFDSKPILEVNSNGSTVLEIGLGIPHMPKIPSYFSSLISNSKPNISIGEFQYILDYIKEIMITDPSISNYHLSYRNSFQIHTQDKGLIKLLREDSENLEKFKLLNTLKRAKKRPNEKLLEKISKDSSLYTLLLSGLSQIERDTFHQDMVRLLETSLYEYDAMMGAYGEETTKKEIKGISNIKKELEQIKAEIGNSHYLIKINGILNQWKKQHQKPKKPIITIETLKNIYDNFLLNPFPIITTNLNFCGFSNIEEMKTQLNKYNPVYSKEIITFKLFETGKELRERKDVLNNLCAKYE